MRLACAYGVSAKMARVRLETCGVLVDPERIARLDREIEEENLHLGLAGLLGLDDLADGLAQAAANRPRLPPALRGSVLGAVLTGELTSPRARPARRREPEFRRALADLGLAGLVPSA